jgi:hypothetical protein
MLVGTWQAAVWAIRFYQCHGFALASPTRKTAEADATIRAALAEVQLSNW